MKSSYEKPFNIYFLVTFVVALCHGFNVDMPSRIVHMSPQPGSWFGYSVAMYKHGNINTLLVGAPKFNTTQPGVVEGGAVLRCSVESANRSCEYVPFDNTSHMRLSHMDYNIDSKSYQFFGATLKSRDGIVVACAPRYVWYTSSRTRREPVGTCYVARQDLTDFQEFSPCRTDKWGYHRQGSCQAGFDAALTSGGDRMYIGAPGAYYWQGQIHSQSLFTRNEYFTTGEGPADEDDQYLGYSVAAGDFTGDGVQDIALGVPKGLNYTGKVSLYSHDLQWVQNITGDQLGSYFGYCLAVIDFNADGLDDIVVGAPMFTDYEDREMKIEVGKVHVLLQNSVHLFRRQIAYFGTVSRGRFGLSVASIGDINLDNYGDFAVGAPYGGQDGRGAVFIYHGFAANEGDKMKTLMTKPAQVIYASDVARSFSTFGWSLAGGLDVDGNEYPDILVGAYEAEHVILFKSRPIIKFLEHKLEFQSEGKTIDAETKNCQIKKGAYHSCVNLVFCLKYTGVNVDDDIELEVEFRLDTKQSSEQRMLFEYNNKNVYRENIRYTRETIRCRNMKTYLKTEIVDKLTPISANVSYILKLRRSSRALTPVLDQDQRLSMQDSLTIQKNCGPDNICIPNLSLNFEAPDEFIVGQKDMLNVSVEVTNEGEDAFEATVLISEPKGLLFNKFEPRESTSCSTRSIDGNTFIKCDIGNPLPKHQRVKFDVFFQQSGELEKPEFEFLVTANSTNAEANTYEDNEARKVVEAMVEAKLTLFGSSDPDSIIYNTSLYQIPVRHHESHYGPSVVHKYGLLSEGPSDIEHAEIVILWPSRTLTDKHLLYLMEQPVTVGKIKCDPLPDINPLNLNTISQEERRSILGLTTLEGTYQASASKQTSSDFHQSSISSKSEKTSSESKSSISSSSSSASSSSTSFSSSTSESRKSSTPTQGRGSSYYYSQSSGSGGSRYGSSSGQVSSSGISHSTGTSSEGSRGYSSGQGGYKEESHFISSSTDEMGRIGHGYSSSGDERSRTATHYPSSSFEGSSRGGGYHTSTSSEHKIQRGNDQYTPSPSSFDGTYREGSYFSSADRGSERGYSASSSGRQRGPILPSSGRDGKFTSTLFNVEGGGSMGGERVSSSSISEGGVSSQSEADQRYYGSTSSGHYSGGRGSVASTSQGHGGGYSSSITYSSPEEKSRSGYASVRKEHQYYSSSDGLGSEHRSHSGSKSDGGQYSSSYYVEHSPGTSSSSSYSHRSSSRSSSSLPDEYYRQNEIDSRRKREATIEDEWDTLVRDCGATLCTRIHCRTERLTANDDVYIYIRSRLWVDTLNEESEFKFPVDDVTVSTRMVARVHVEPHEIASESSNLYTKNVVTPIRSAKSLAEAPPVPWWVILLATLAGILILLLIILVLWKLGFFKRQRAKSTKS